jgi:predicted phosphodiesterase
MREHERELHRNEMADIFIATAERFEHSAIFIHPNPDTEEERWRMVDLIREKIGGKYFLLMHGDATLESDNDRVRLMAMSQRPAAQVSHAAGKPNGK